MHASNRAADGQWKRIGAIALALVAGMMAEAAFSQDSRDMAEIERGREVFLSVAGIGCAGCHGQYAEGDVGIGPYNRGVGGDTIREALGSVESMEFLREELTERQIRQIAAYYEWLGELQLFKTLVKRGRFLPDTIQVHPGVPIQLVVQNSGRADQTFASDNMGIDPFTVPGRSDLDVVWTAPLTEGDYSLACTDCRLADQRLTIAVSRAVEPPPGFVPPVVDVIALGRDLFLNAGGVGCVACHGQYAEGDVGIGPYNRGFDEQTIRDALANVGVMAFLRDALPDEQVGHIAAYYARLGELELVKTLMVGPRFLPDRLHIRPRTEIQLVVANATLTDHRFVSDDMGIAEFTVAGRDRIDFEWTAPSDEGTYTLVCADCPASGTALTIEVSE